MKELLWIGGQGLYLLSTLTIYLLACLVTPKRGRWLFGAHRGTSYEGNAKHLFEYVSEVENVEAAWITRQAIIVSELRSKGYRCYSFYSLAGLWFSMTSSAAFVTHRGNNQRGDLPFFAISKKTKIIQLWHGIPLKKIGFDDKLFSHKKPSKLAQFLLKLTPWLFPFSDRVQEPDMVVALSEESKKLFASAFRVNDDIVKIMGYPRNDALFLPPPSEQRLSTKIVFMPTFRGGEGDVFDILGETNFDSKYIDRFCAEHQIFIDIKLHPFNLPTKEMLQKIGTSQHVRLLDSEDIYNRLSDYDVLITDYSSVYFDFLLLDRPIVFFPFQHEDFVCNDRELYFDYDDVTPGPKVESWDEILALLADLRGLEARYREDRQLLLKRFHDFQDAGSCERVSHAILALEGERHG